MSYLVLDQNFEVLGDVEQYDSLIWTERFFTTGDFQIVTDLSPVTAAFYQEDDYVYSTESDTIMIIEDVEITDAPTEGRLLKITGRSLESILDRRIVWQLIEVSGNLQNAIRALLGAFLEDPNTARRIPNFVYVASTDVAVTSLTLPEPVQFQGESILDALSSLCEIFGIGFKITLTEDNKFRFQLYAGKNRTFDQVALPQVIFSPSYDNLAKSKYLRSKRGYKNFALVGGEGQGNEKKFTTISRPGSDISGLSRREVYVSSSATTQRDNPTSPEEYAALMQLDGARELVKRGHISVFDGEVVNSTDIEYQKDYFMGDLVSLEDIYIPEAQGTSRVTEFIRTHDATGHRAYPTLTSV